MDRYLVITGIDVPAVVVGPFPQGFNALKDFPLPPGYDTASSHETREEAEKEAQWYWDNP
jgi:hypothetical protein